MKTAPSPCRRCSARLALHVERPDHQGSASHIMGSGRIRIMHAPKKAARPFNYGQTAAPGDVAARQQTETPGRFSREEEATSLNRCFHIVPRQNDYNQKLYNSFTLPQTKYGSFLFQTRRQTPGIKRSGASRRHPAPLDGGHPPQARPWATFRGQELPETAFRQ